MDPDRSLEDHNLGDQCLDSKTSDQVRIGYLRSAKYQVTGLRARLQWRTASHLRLLDKLIMATDPIRQ